MRNEELKLVEVKRMRQSHFDDMEDFVVFVEEERILRNSSASWRMLSYCSAVR